VSALLVSVVIPTYQRRDTVRRALHALAEQSLPPDAYEVVVSVDGSTDGTLEMLGEMATPYPLRVVSGPNRGRAAACNAGIREARGELVVLLDDDMEPVRHFLAAHREAHGAEPALGVIGAVPVPLDAASPPVVRYVGEKFNRHLEALARSGRPLGLRDFYSGNFSIRRELLLRSGGFDEDFRVYGNEDLELSLRLRRAGVRLVFSPEAAARQSYTKDFAGLAGDNVAKGRTAVLLAGKYPGTVAELKLGTAREGPVALRLVRDALLAAGDAWPALPCWILRTLAALERRGLARSPRFYALALGYFYWTGARAAMRENRRSGRGLAEVPAPAGVFRQ
jgi:glycosyltransferase involved in cell wall biosynthesis